MKFTVQNSGLLIPKEKKPDSTTHPHGLPQEERFRFRMWHCSYEENMENFVEMVKEKGGIVCGVVEAPFLNIWNDKVGTEYVCVYLYKEDLEMEVWC